MLRGPQFSHSRRGHARAHRLSAGGRTVRERAHGSSAYVPALRSQFRPAAGVRGFTATAAVDRARDRSERRVLPSAGTSSEYRRSFRRYIHAGQPCIGCLSTRLTYRTAADSSGDGPVTCPQQQLHTGTAPWRPGLTAGHRGHRVTPTPRVTAGNSHHSALRSGEVVMPRHTPQPERRST